MQCKLNKFSIYFIESQIEWTRRNDILLSKNRNEGEQKKVMAFFAVSIQKEKRRQSELQEDLPNDEAETINQKKAQRARYEESFSYFSPLVLL